MQRFNCPFCGMRDQSEFTYMREVATIPALDAVPADWQRFVYQRDNPCGAHAEWWHHNHGCRQVLKIVRDTLTHEVLEIEAARTTGERGSDAEPPQGAKASSGGSAGAEVASVGTK